jgi:hypothetical protein
MSNEGQMTWAERKRAQGGMLKDPALRELATSENILDRFAEEIGRTLAGEEHAARLLYLICTSRLLPTPMSAVIKGSSAGGKSYLRKQVLEFFPGTSILRLTSMSEKALYFCEDDFQHKILSVGEAQNNKEAGLQDMILRELISEGEIRHQMTVKEGNNLKGKVVEKRGPVTFLITTTGTLHAENETRVLSIEVQDTEDQTRAILQKIANQVANEPQFIDYELWRDFQLFLAEGTRQVEVPYADWLARAIPAKRIRVRRDFTQVISAIQTHTLIHQCKREKRHDGQLIVADERDYEAIRAIMNPMLSASTGIRVDDKLSLTVRAVKNATASMHELEGATGYQVGEKFDPSLDKGVARKRLIDAAKEGYVVNLETRRGQPAKWRLTDQPVPNQGEALPPYSPHLAFTDATVHPNGKDHEEEILIGEHSSFTRECALSPDGEAVNKPFQGVTGSSTA